MSDDGQKVITWPDNTAFSEREPALSEDDVCATLKVWDLGTGRLEHTLNSQGKSVESVAVTRNGHRAISATCGMLSVWDLQTGECLRRIESGPILSVALSADGKRAISGSGNPMDADGGYVLRVWDLEASTDLPASEWHNGRVLAVALTVDEQRAVSWGDSRKLWDLNTGECLRTSEECYEDVFGSMITLDFQKAVSGDQTQKVVNSHVKDDVLTATMTGHGRVHMVRLSLADQSEADGSSGNILKVWNLQTGECLRTLIGHGDLLRTVAASHDDRMMYGKNALMALDVKTGRLGPTQWPSYALLAVAIFSDNGSTIAACHDGTLKVWKLEEGEGITSFTSDATITACAVAPDGMTFVAGDQLGRVHLLRLEGVTPCAGAPPVSPLVPTVPCSAGGGEHHATKGKSHEAGPPTQPVAPEPSPTACLETDAPSHLLRAGSPCDSIQEQVLASRPSASAVRQELVAYHERMVEWRSLPLWKRLFRKAPQRPASPNSHGPPLG